jgi:ribonuclease-3
MAIDSDFEKNLGYTFKNAELLKLALTHPSLTSARRGNKSARQVSPYERLEFLGDRVVGLVIAKALYDALPFAHEGELAMRFSALVKGDTLKLIALDLKLDTALQVAKSELSHDEIKRSSSTLADAMEAVIGALYLDAGITEAENFIIKHWKKYFNVQPEAMTDPKTGLQELVQSKKLPTPVYVTIESSGPSHSPDFVIEVQVKGLPHCTGKGHSKKEAQKAAAAALLELIHNLQSD